MYKCVKRAEKEAKIQIFKSRSLLVCAALFKDVDDEDERRRKQAFSSFSEAPNLHKIALETLSQVRKFF